MSLSLIRTGSYFRFEFRVLESMIEIMWFM